MTKVLKLGLKILVTIGCVQMLVNLLKSNDLKNAVSIVQQDSKIQQIQPKDTPKVAKSSGSQHKDKLSFCLSKFTSTRDLGLCDGEKLVELLSVLYSKHPSSLSNHKIIIDIGANVGRTSNKFMYFLTDHHCRIV